MMDRNIGLEAVRLTEAAAIASARMMGRGDEKAADQAAVDAMRKAFNELHIRGTIVIGEGERDEAPMLYIGEKVGRGASDDPEVDIALDPLEGTTLTATGGPSALSVLAMADKGNLLNAPDTYMDKIAVGPSAKGAIDLRRTPLQNLRAIADKKGVYIEDLTVIILSRPRHEKLIADVRQTVETVQPPDGKSPGGDRKADRPREHDPQELAEPLAQQLKRLLRRTTYRRGALGLGRHENGLSWRSKIVGLSLRPS